MRLTGVSIGEAWSVYPDLIYPMSRHRKSPRTCSNRSHIKCTCSRVIKRVDILTQTSSPPHSTHTNRAPPIPRRGGSCRHITGISTCNILFVLLLFFMFEMVFFVLSNCLLTCLGNDHSIGPERNFLVSESKAMFELQ